jgi:hypothetical protein
LTFRVSPGDSLGKSIGLRVKVDGRWNPTGYEGYLADNYRFLQPVLLREPSCRARYYRPLGQYSPGN